MRIGRLQPPQPHFAARQLHQRRSHLRLQLQRAL